MKKLKINNIDKYKVKKSKHKFRWQKVAEELSDYYSKQCYWVFHRYPLGLIEQAYREQKAKNDTELQHLLFILSNKQNMPTWIASKFLEIKKRDKEKAKNFLELKKGKLKTVTYNYLAKLI